MENNIIRRVVILGAITIIGILGIQGYWVMRTWDIQQQEFSQTVKIALLSVAKELETLNGRNSLPIKGLISQQSSNTYIVNINDEINANTLEFYLQKELEARAVNADFEYGIFDCESREMVYGRRINYSEDKELNTQTNPLPTNGDFDYYFSVRFPNQKGYLLEDMRLAIFFSIILFFSILFFIYSMFIIMRQKRLSEMQKDFINNMTHEFKTPISTIKISADVFLKNEVIKNDQRLSRYAQIIKEQNQRLNMQVEKVLQLAKIERNGFSLKKEAVNVHELLAEITASAQVRLGEVKGSLITEFNATQPNIQADRLHLNNILYNLIDNAIKYSYENPEVRLTTRNEGNQFIISIEDNGIGITRENQQRVFDKFYRVPTGDIHNVKGFGLGLFYVKNICDAHEWELELHSEPGKGTKIEVLIGG